MFLYIETLGDVDIMNVLKLFSDLETPVSIFLKVATSEDYCFLLESTEHEANFGRFSFIGLGQKEEYRLDSKGNLYINGQKQVFKGSPLKIILKKLEELSKRTNIPELEPFSGGAFGYVAYDYVRYIEDFEVKHSKEDIFRFVVPEYLIIFDHFMNQLHIVGEKPESIAKKIDRSMPPFVAEKPFTTEPNSNFSKHDFEEAVKKAKQYIINGDIFQVVISQRFDFNTSLRPFSIYRALRMLNPSPYMFFIKNEEKILLGSSPEMMSKYTGKEVIVKPIAGTRKRGRTVAEDIIMEHELLGDEKENAEHIMLVDLARNDVGKVSKRGTVKVDEMAYVKKFSHVMHLVSNVSGEVEDNKDAVDVFDSTFPAGTLSGAPKRRAMEIIDELEPDARGLYSGAVGYFAFPDAENKIKMDSGIVIRSFSFDGESASLQSGAGIVYDSTPEFEFKETINKLQALFQSIDVARKIEGG
jgi:anthranilate synthase component 1